MNEETYEEFIARLRAHPLLVLEARQSGDDDIEFMMHVQQRLHRLQSIPAVERSPNEEDLLFELPILGEYLQ